MGSDTLNKLYEKVGTFEVNPDVQFFSMDGLIVRRMSGPAGAVFPMHVHPNKGHLSILAVGRAQVIRDSGITDHEAGDCIEIAPSERHGIVFVTACIWFCLGAED